MFDKKLYIETYSALHASKDTLAKIQRITLQDKRKINYLPRPAFVLSIVLVLVISSAALAAASQILYGGWVHHATLKDAEKMGFHYPIQIGEYQLSKSSPSRIHMAPKESGGLAAWLNPHYTWMSLDYENNTSQFLSVSFGKMNDPLWTYCFGYNEKTEAWLGLENPEDFDSTSTDSHSYIENVTEYEYEGCTIYLADRVTEYKTDMSMLTKKTEIEAHWADSEIGLCFSISSGTDWAQNENNNSSADIQSMTQKEMLKYVRSIIDHNR